MVVILSESLLVGIDSFKWLALRSLEYKQTIVSRNIYKHCYSAFKHVNMNIHLVKCNHLIKNPINQRINWVKLKWDNCTYIYWRFGILLKSGIGPVKLQFLRLLIEPSNWLTMYRWQTLTLNISPYQTK